MINNKDIIFYYNDIFQLIHQDIVMFSSCILCIQYKCKRTGFNSPLNCNNYITSEIENYKKSTMDFFIKGLLI